jgi:hypothetical protein
MMLNFAKGSIFELRQGVQSFEYSVNERMNHDRI